MKPSRGPARAAHPSTRLYTEIRERGWGVRDLAARLGYNPSTVLALLTGGIDIDPDLAERLARALGTSADLWINLQAAYDAAWKGYGTDDKNPSQ